MEIKVNQIMLATRNKDKIREIKEILSCEVEIKTFLDYPDAPSVIEDKDSIEANSQKKAIEIARFTGLYSIADDSGLFVDALGFSPGVYSSRWAGEGCSYRDNNLKLLNMLKGVKWEDRKASFKCAITIASPDGRFHTEVGEVRGYILEEMRGENGFGYDPLFFVKDFNSTFAQMPPELKNKISHRAKALKLIKPYLEKVIYYGVI